MKYWQKMLVIALVALGFSVEFATSFAQAIDTNLTAMVTSFDTTVTSGTGAHTVYWVVGLGVGITIISLVIGFVKKGKRT